MNSNAIDVERLSFSYPSYTKRGIVTLFENLSFSLEMRTNMLLLGAPDAGKSTLTKILCNLIPRYIEGNLTGTIRIGGKGLAEIDPSDMIHMCTLVGQNPQEQLLMTTCADEIAFPLESLHYEREKIANKVRSSLHKWDLLTYAEVNPQELSGGESKRLLLAVTDAIDAPLWIMDEPFDDLDLFWRRFLLHEILSHKRSVLVCASRYIEEFRGSFDQYGLLSERTLAIDDEEAIVIAFDRMCDIPYEGDEEDPPINERDQVLSCSDIQIVHPRRSVKNLPPFTLSVPHFSVKSGEIVALIGPNGSGKSTLSRILCGLDHPARGTIELNGVSLSPKELNRTVGYVFQNPDYGIFLSSVKDELSYSLQQSKTLTSAEKEHLIGECANLFLLDLEETPATMSYGARKHLQVAVYYVLHRPFIIIDELDSGVTYAAAFEIVTRLRNQGAGIIVITHDSTFASRLTQTHYIIEHGVVSVDGGKR